MTTVIVKRFAWTYSSSRGNMGSVAARKKRQSEQAREPAGPAALDDGPRQRMVAGAARLLATRGLQATSFSEVLEATKTPRGSVYHHFPDGKEQLVRDALDFAGQQLWRVLASKDGASAEEITELFLHVWRELLTRSHFGAGCALVAVTVAADSRELLAHAGAIFRGWRGRIAELLTKGGLEQREADAFAALLIAASEGAVVLCRAEQDIEPFELVAKQLLGQVRKRRVAKPRT